MPRYIGFDAHKSYAYVAELREDGERLDYRVALPDGLPGFKQRLGADCQLVLEASTNTFRLVDELKPHVGKIVVTDPAQTRGAISRPATTDRNAAFALARLLASDFVRPVWVPPQEIRSLRNLVELRVRLTRQQATSVNRIRAMLRQELVPGRPTLVEGEVRAKIGDDPTLQAYCSSLFRFKDLVRAECEQVDSVLHAWCRESKDARLLMSIPGVGPLVAACVVAQVGDIKRFSSARKLCSYAGLVPRVHSSGQTHRSGSISKMGRRTLRWAMGIAAMSATRADAPLAKFKENLCERRPKAVAMVACARKLLASVWRVWTTAKPYDDQDAERYCRKLARLDRGKDCDEQHPDSESREDVEQKPKAKGRQRGRKNENREPGDPTPTTL